MKAFEPYEKNYLDKWLLFIHRSQKEHIMEIGNKLRWAESRRWVERVEPTTIVQAQPSWKVTLLSGSYCSREMRVGEGRPDASQFLIIARKISY